MAAARATWTDGELLAVVEATHAVASGQQAEFGEDWRTAVAFLALSLTRDRVRARDVASARRHVVELAVRIIEAEAARTLSGACGATSPMAIRARTALQAAHPEAWLRRQLEGLGRERT